MAQMDQVLAQLGPAERARLESALDAASKAIWRARQALNGQAAPQISVDEWRAYLRTVAEAVAAVESLVSPR